MAIYCVGSINADIFYDVPHIPAPGETLAATARSTGLGGKGANQSVAAALAGAQVTHIGAVGEDGRWAIERFQGWGIDTSGIAVRDVPTGHAIISVAADGENAIVLFPGANHALDEVDIRARLAAGQPGDLVLMQNETSSQRVAAEAATAAGLRLIYSAAPFSVDAVRAVLPLTAILVVNEVEDAQLAKAGDVGAPKEGTLVTLGADGAEWRPVDGPVIRVPAFPVDPIDTTGAGDTFAGYVAAGLDQGLDIEAAMRLGCAAAAVKVTKKGTADAIPSRAEVDAFLASR